MAIYILKWIERSKATHSILSTKHVDSLIVSKGLSYWVPVKFLFLSRRQY